MFLWPFYILEWWERMKKVVHQKTNTICLSHGFASQQIYWKSLKSIVFRLAWPTRTYCFQMEIAYGRTNFVCSEFGQVCDQLLLAPEKALRSSFSVCLLMWFFLSVLFLVGNIVISLRLLLRQQEWRRIKNYVIWWTLSEKTCHQMVRISSSIDLSVYSSFCNWYLH